MAEFSTVPDRGRHPHPTVKGRESTPRLPNGHLIRLVLEHLRKHPHLDFSPYEVAKVLGRSHGTIRRILFTLAASGQVVQTSARPARFRAAT